MRWLPWRRRLPDTDPPLRDDGSLLVLGESRDPARSDSAAVAEMADRGVDLDRPLLVRHFLVLPGQSALDEAARLLAPDGYALFPDSAPRTAQGFLVRASRTQRVTGLSLAQERTRMAGLAARLCGDVEGWDVCGPGELPADR